MLGAKLVEEGLRYLFVVEEGGRARVGRLVSFPFAIKGNGGADLGEGGCEVVCGVDEGGAGVTDGMQTNSTRPHYFQRARSNERYLSVFSVYF